MPIYEYRCESCGQTIERLQKLSAPPLTVCPACEGTLKKLISAPAFQFKGSGWYVTDYADKGGKPASDKGESGSGESASEASGSSGEKDSGGAKTSNGKSKDSATGSQSTSSKSSTTSDKSKAS